MALFEFEYELSAVLILVKSTPYDATFLWCVLPIIVFFGELRMLLIPTLMSNWCGE